MVITQILHVSGSHALQKHTVLCPVHGVKVNHPTVGFIIWLSSECFDSFSEEEVHAWLVAMVVVAVVALAAADVDSRCC